MTQTAKNYGDAIYELARDEACSEQILHELKGVAELFAQNPDYLRLLSASNLPVGERLQNLDEAFSGRVHRYLLYFLKLLVERGHINELRYCLRRFRSRYCDDHGILEAVAVTAVPLRAELLEKLSHQLSDRTGKKVELRNRVDSSVLGGVRLEYDGQSLDGTLRRRLEGIEKTLSDTVL